MRRTILLLLATMSLAVLLASGVALAETTVIKETFSNTSRTTILDRPTLEGSPRAANPYPSQIAVSGFNQGSIRDVNLKLKGFSHTALQDVDIILQHGTQSAIVMSDVGGSSTNNPNAQGFQLTLDDEANTTLPALLTSASGSFKPTDHDTFAGDEPFPSPAESLPTNGSALSVFDGSDPNGTWNLFVVDDEPFEKGKIGSWTLVIKARVPV
jgi:hypothetical protein